MKLKIFKTSTNTCITCSAGDNESSNSTSTYISYSSSYYSNKSWVKQADVFSTTSKTSSDVKSPGEKIITAFDNYSTIDVTTIPDGWLPMTYPSLGAVGYILFY